MNAKFLLAPVLLALAGMFPIQAAAAVQVANTNGGWDIVGAQRRVRLEPETLRMVIQSAGHTWRLAGSQGGDLTVRTAGQTTSLSLASATNRTVTPYTTGTRTGVKVALSGFGAGAPDLHLQLFITLEGREEEVLCECLATDATATVRELQWPGPMEPESFDTAVVPFMQGMLLPKNWPERAWLYDTLAFGRGLYMPWWGFQSDTRALLVLLETPDDAGCQFAHPAGGPTRLGPRWVASLGRWAYPRRVRFCSLDSGDYVALAKRYRRHAIESGRFVSLREKIARNPRVGEMLGTPVVHTSILYHIQPESSYFKTNDPAQNHQLVTFDTRAAELRRLAERGYRRAYVHLDGWGARGYDNLHPDVLPPCVEAGGVEGMKRLADTCDQLGFLLALHDQYRDFFLDAASYDPRHTLLDEAGNRPLHSTWYGGQQSILCSRLAPEHVRHNHQTLLDQGVRLRGAYLDVFSVVPPDECFAWEHPVTRTECLRYRGECLDLVRSWGGIVSSEEPSDWSIPYLDLVHHGPYALRPDPGKGPAMGVPVPLFNLVYHDALLTPWSLGQGAWGIPETDPGWLHGLGNAGLPYLSLSPDDKEQEQVRAMCALHRRVGLLELRRHAFLDPQRRRQAFVYADETRVVIDLDAQTYAVTPPLR